MPEQQKNSQLVDLFDQAARLIQGADALVIGAGAGMGVDSGLPDFRGNEGFWNAYPALARARLDFTDIANQSTFEADATLAWGFYGHRLNLYRQTEPHGGFALLREWSESKAMGHWVFTSNVDGQFQKAGFSEDSINECHGSIHYLQCMSDCVSGFWRGDSFAPEVDTDACRITNAAPACIVCGGLARPNILMFGDWNWVDERKQAQRKRERAWLDRLVKGETKVVVVEIGAGTSIPSVRHFSQGMSRDYGAHIVRINPREPQVAGSNDIGIALGAFEALAGIDAAMHRQAEPR